MDIYVRTLLSEYHTIYSKQIRIYYDKQHKCNPEPYKQSRL